MEKQTTHRTSADMDFRDWMILVGLLVLGVVLGLALMAIMSLNQPQQ